MILFEEFVKRFHVRIFKSQAKYNNVIRRGSDGAMQIERLLIPEMPAELQEIIKEMG